MLKLSITEDDNVLLCMPVAQAVVVVPGSYVTGCDECGAAVWRDSRPPLLQVNKAGDALEPAGFLRAQAITIVLCLACGAAHQAAGH